MVIRITQLSARYPGSIPGLGNICATPASLGMGVEVTGNLHLRLFRIRPLPQCRVLWCSTAGQRSCLFFFFLFFWGGPERCSLYVYGGSFAIIRNFAFTHWSNK